MSRAFRKGVTMKLAIPIPDGKGLLYGNLDLPEAAEALVVFVHGSGSSRHSRRNKYVAALISESGLGTLLFDLLTESEEAEDALTGRLRFDIPLLAERVEAVTRWIKESNDLSRFHLGYFGASTGAAAAIVAAGRTGSVLAVVSRGGRPDLADDYLGIIECPTLLIVGGNDDIVIDLNMSAMSHLKCKKELVIVEGAGHLFEEPGRLEEVSKLAIDWFKKYLV